MTCRRLAAERLGDAVPAVNRMPSGAPALPVASWEYAARRLSPSARQDVARVGQTMLAGAHLTAIELEALIAVGRP